jgi:predicted Zn-dependent protease with MMP-like domain
MRGSTLVRMASQAVAATQRGLPPDILEVAKSVPVHFEPRPGPDVQAEGFEPDILGLFSGSPHAEGLAGGDPMPAQICLYTANLWDFAEGDEAAFRAEARLTYLHELGHYLGWDEDQLTARGLD